MKVLAWVVGIPVAGFLLLLVIGSNAGPPSAKSKARQAIELCWSEQGRKSLDPGTARIIAGVCENLEADFLRQYGVKP